MEMNAMMSCLRFIIAAICRMRRCSALLPDILVSAAESAAFNSPLVARVLLLRIDSRIVLVIRMDGLMLAEPSMNSTQNGPGKCYVPRAAVAHLKKRSDHGAVPLSAVAVPGEVTKHKRLV